MLFINDAVAATPAAGAAAHQSSSMSLIFMMVIFIALLYFMIWRPQSKRAKDQRNLVSSLKVGDEVSTLSGFVGKLTKVDDNFVDVELADNVVVKMQKSAVSGVLPKGTIKA